MITAERAARTALAACPRRPMLTLEQSRTIVCQVEHGRWDGPITASWRRATNLRRLVSHCEPLYTVDGAEVLR